MRICAHTVQCQKAFLRFVRPSLSSDARTSRKTNIAREGTDQITRTPVKMRPDFSRCDSFRNVMSSCNEILYIHYFSFIPDGETITALLSNEAFYRHSLLSIRISYLYLFKIQTSWLIINDTGIIKAFYCFFLYVKKERSIYFYHLNKKSSGYSPQFYDILNPYQGNFWIRTNNYAFRHKFQTVAH